MSLIKSLNFLSFNAKPSLKIHFFTRCCCMSTVSSQFFKDGIYKSHYPDFSASNQDICAFIMSKWEKWSNREALECVASGRRMTYGQLMDATLRFGGILKSLNLFSTPDVATVPGNKTVRIPQRIAILSPNTIECVPVLFGTLAAGFSLTPINPTYTIGEITHHLKDTTPQALVVHHSREDIVDEALSQLKINIPILTIGESKQRRPNLSKLIEETSRKQISPAEMNPSDTAFILYSSGTTGLPKGVAIKHSALVNNLLSYTSSTFYPYGPEDRQTVMGLLPFFHVYGLLLVCTNMSLGAKIAICQEMDPLNFGNIIKTQKIERLHLVPTLMNFIINSGLVTKDHLATLKGAFIGAAPVLPFSANAFQKKCGRPIKFQEGYGMTECLCTHFTPLDSVRIGFCGKLLPNIEAKLVDIDTGDQLTEPGKRGELLIRSQSTMSHYLNNPIATSETLDDEGWLRTGDVAVSTEDGYFSIIDRIKELIKVKELQVSPAEIEDVLVSHPAVTEAGVVGIPDERVGERPRAYVTLKAKVAEEELVKLVEKNLSSHKWLTGGVVILDHMPKTQAGKILRRELKELAIKNPN